MPDNVMNQNHLPLNNRPQCEDEKGKEELAAQSASEDMDFFDAQNHEDGCTGQKVFYREESKRTFLQIEGHYRIYFLCSVVHQVKREVSVDYGKSDRAHNGSKKTSPMQISEGRFSHPGAFH